MQTRKTVHVLALAASLLAATAFTALAQDSGQSPPEKTTGAGTVTPSETSPDAMSQGMIGPGIVGPGVMGLGMTGPGWGYIMPSFNLTINDVRAAIERWLAAWGNPHVKLGKITEGQTTITAEIVTQDNSLVERIEVDKQTGLYHMVP
jgi:hypothetical protein